MDSNESKHNSGIQSVEKLLHENDVKGAIDFAKSVRTSSTKLKGLSCFLANIVVQVSSEDQETDWYTVLGVDPSADPKTMRIHYVQQAKQIRRTGSCEAHKLLDEAWRTLSNKVTRKEYDLRRISRELQQNPLAVRQESAANETHALENVNNAVLSNQQSLNNNCSIGGSDERNHFADHSEINAMDWENIWNPQENYAPHELLDPLAVRQESPANENISHALENVTNAVVSNQQSLNNNCSIGGSDIRNDFANQREINAMDWENIWNPQANYAPHEPLYTFLTACPSCHYESYRVCLISQADCLQCGKAFAAIEVPSPDAKHKERMTLVQTTGDSIKNVPENCMPVGSAGQGCVNLCQAGNSGAEKVGSSGSSKGNRKKRLLDLEKNISMKKPRNVNLEELHERNASDMDYNERNAADSIENAASEGHDFDQDKTHESFEDNQLMAIYVEMMEYFEHLLKYGMY